VGVALDDPAHIRIFEAVRRALLDVVVNPHSGTDCAACLCGRGSLRSNRTRAL
jgi:hypothetical protein